jgi:hypothetical protein
MKQTLIFLTIGVLGVAFAVQSGNSGARGAGIAETTEGKKAEVKMKLANQTKEGKTLLFGELEAQAVNRQEQTTSIIRVSPANNRVPVRGKLKVEGNIATLEALGVLTVRSKNKVERFEGTVRARIEDSSVEGQDKFSVSFKKGDRSISFEGIVKKGNLVVWTGGSQP